MVHIKTESVELDIFRKSLRDFLQEHAAPHFEQWEEEKQVPRSFWLEMGKQGFLCPWADEQYGGSNADFHYSVVINEELSNIGAGIGGIGLHNDVVMPYIEEFGTPEQKQRWLPKSISGEIISAIAMTEPGAGSDLAGIKTTAILDGDHYIVNGEKTFITNGYSCDLAIVVVLTDPKAEPIHKGISLLAIEANTPGFSKGKKLRKVGQHANDTSELIFENCRVPKENLIGMEGLGFYYLMKKLQQERLVLAIGCIAEARRMLDITVDYVKQRKAFGRPISKFQNTQFKIAEMATQVKMGETFVKQCVADHIAGRDITTEVSMAKWWITDMAQQIAIDCMQLHGGFGYMEEYEIARRYRDVAVGSIYAGTNEIMKTIIAKNLGL